MTKPSRNDLCSCGSGKKFKKCCAQKNFVSRFSLPENPEQKINQAFLKRSFKASFNEEQEKK